MREYDDHGDLCTEIRVLPCGDSNMHCGIRGYHKEIAFRKERNKTVWNPFDLPAWEDLKIYFKDGKYEYE